jgi:hypothetical protein
VSNIKFDIWIYGGPYTYSMKITKDGKVLCHSEFISKVLPGPLPDLSD